MWPSGSLKPNAVNIHVTHEYNKNHNLAQMQNVYAFAHRKNHFRIKHKHTDHLCLCEVHPQTGHLWGPVGPSQNGQ